MGDPDWSRANYLEALSYVSNNMKPPEHRMSIPEFKFQYDKFKLNDPKPIIKVDPLKKSRLSDEDNILYRL